MTDVETGGCPECGGVLEMVELDLPKTAVDPPGLTKVVRCATCGASPN